MKERRKLYDVIEIVDSILKLVQKNYNKDQMRAHCLEVFDVKTNNFEKFYNQAMAELKKCSQETIQTIREQRIYALNQDIKTSFKNYENALKDDNGKLALLWFAQYQSCKNQLDNYYPNQLKVDSGEATRPITITFTEAVRRE
jgi:hypothetical protein